MKRALVFGAGGQLGAAVSERLAARGWQVTAVTREGRRAPGAAEHLDATGKDRRAVFAEATGTFDGVFEPGAYDDHDAAALIAERGRFGSLVAVSTASVYARRDGLSMVEGGVCEHSGPIAEDAPVVAPGPEGYARRKAAMEQALLGSGLATSILRPCAVHGTRSLHPREWWFLKRGLDGRPRIPLAFGGSSVFHTSGVGGIASLVERCFEEPGARLLNVGDPVAPCVTEIAAVLERLTGLSLPLAPYEGPPEAPAHVGSTPWSVALPFVLDTRAARALGWDGGPDYADAIAPVCHWILETARRDDWKKHFTRFTAYGYDPFDYEAEDRFLTGRG